MKRQNVSMRKIGDTELSASVTDGEVIGWQPLTLHELNTDIAACVRYLLEIKGAIQDTKGG